MDLWLLWNLQLGGGLDIAIEQNTFQEKVL